MKAKLSWLSCLVFLLALTVIRVQAQDLVTEIVYSNRATELAPLLSHNIPLNDNCILNCREI